MQYSLWSRFQGCLIGSRIAPGLIEPWPSLQQKVLENFSQGREALVIDELNLELQKGSSSEWALVLLPLILWFHDTPTELEDFLQKITVGRLSKGQSDRGVLSLWAKAITLILTDSYSPQFFLTLANASVEKSLSRQLEQLEENYHQGLGLVQVANAWRQEPEVPKELLLALYCFRCTPGEWRLSVDRARCWSSPLTVALTGAIAGAYNGPRGTQQINTPALLAYQRFFAQWSGQNTPDSTLSTIPEISAPGCLQRRSSSKLMI